MYDQETQQWIDWMDTCSQFQCNPDTPFAEIMVPTALTIRYTFVMRRLLLAGHNVLAVGETGTGKTLAVQVLLLRCGIAHANLVLHASL